jgi:hypothetical protein
MFKLKKNTYLLKHFKVNKSFVVVNNDSFILKMLLLIICATRTLTIRLSRFQQHHLGLDELLNKILEPK